MLILLQLLGGAMLAIVIWVLIKAAFNFIAWGLSLMILIIFIFPGLLFFTGALLFTFIGLLAALGILLIRSAFRS